MTNDELLAGFLDRSLSEDQLLEFEARREADSEFARQAEAMIRVEKVIPMAAPAIAVPSDFLHAVEADVATKVASGTSGGFFSGLASSTWSWITGRRRCGHHGRWRVRRHTEQRTSSRDCRRRRTNPRTHRAG